METPPAERFTFIDIIKPAEVDELRRVREHLQEISSRADSFSAPNKKRDFEVLRHRHHCNPSEETFMALEGAIGMITPQEIASAELRARELKRAAQRLTMKFFQDHALPILLPVFDRALARLRIELGEQQGRERVWAKYYGVGVAESEVCRFLQHGISRLEQRKNFLQAEPGLSRRPPDLASLLLELGIVLEECAEPLARSATSSAATAPAAPSSATLKPRATRS